MEYLLDGYVAVPSKTVQAEMYEEKLSLLDPIFAFSRYGDNALILACNNQDIELGTREEMIMHLALKQYQDINSVVV